MCVALAERGAAADNNMPAHKQNLLDRFNKYWVPIPFSGCWLWFGNGNRYGKLKVRDFGKVQYISAHRVSYLLHKGEIPQGTSVLHTCDVEGCVNPDHLYLGNTSDNQKDRFRRSQRVRRGVDGKFTCGS